MRLIWACHRGSELTFSWKKLGWHCYLKRTLSKPTSYQSSYVTVNVVLQVESPFGVRSLFNPVSGLRSKRYMSGMGDIRKIENLNFDNLAIQLLPVDTIEANYRRQVPNACFSLVSPTPVDNPRVVAYSKSALELLDLPHDEAERADFAEYFSGSKAIPNSQTAAHCYCGHQFGYFSGQLGDGAALYMGEILNTRGERWELQLKGGGLTPYSRQADGRKVLRSSIREFLCSEAMHFLGIPTTRAGSCVTSDTRVVRDIFYSGDPVLERATVVSRIAPTFLRFGSFEIFKPRDKFTGRAGPSEGRRDILLQMLKYSIETFYPQIYKQYKHDMDLCYLEFYKEVVRRTARLVALWQSCGFCHGVLNTDNMSIMGLTIDYGPFGFMDYFHPDFVCNASDDRGRYSFESQPSICKWNCMKFAEAIQEALPLEKSSEALELIYDKEFQESYLCKMRAKLGLTGDACSGEDRILIEDLFETMKETAADFTNVFRGLARVNIPAPNERSKPCDDEITEYFVEQCQSAEDLKKRQASGNNMQQMQLFMMLMRMNPALLEQMGEPAAQLQRELEKLEKAKELESLTQEEKTKNDRKQWCQWIAKYRSHLAKITGGLSNADVDKLNAKRVEMMNSVNPRFILRNHIAQKAIEAAEADDFSEVRRVLKILEQPFSDGPVDLEFEKEPKPSTDKHKMDQPRPSSSKTSSAACAVFERYDKKAPAWAADLKVT